MPLAVKTPSHQHTLKLEYARPYDFQCDLCKKPSYTGWLYRCSLCEFDVHLACAITNKGAKLLHHQMVPKPPNSLDRNINKQQELMELLTRGLTKSVEEIKDGEIEEDESNQFMPQDQQTPLPEDPSFMSYQFSDACFSIDFAKSLLGSDDGTTGMTQVSKGANDRLSLELPEVIETENPWNLTHGNVIIVDPPKHKKQESVTSTNVESPSPQLRNSFNGLKISLSAGIDSHIWMQLGPETEKRSRTEFKDKSATATDHRRNTSDRVRMGCSCWSRGLMSLFYIRGFCKTSKTKSKKE